MTSHLRRKSKFQNTISLKWIKILSSHVKNQWWIIEVIMTRKKKWIGHKLRTEGLLKDAIGRMWSAGTPTKGIQNRNITEKKTYTQQRKAYRETAVLPGHVSRVRTSTHRGLLSAIWVLAAQWLERLTGEHQKVVGLIPVWGSETFFWVCDNDCVGNNLLLVYYYYQAESQFDKYINRNIKRSCTANTEQYSLTFRDTYIYIWIFLTLNRKRWREPAKNLPSGRTPNEDDDVQKSSKNP